MYNGEEGPSNPTLFPAAPNSLSWCCEKKCTCWNSLHKAERLNPLFPGFGISCSDSLFRNLLSTSSGKGKQFSGVRLITSAPDVLSRCAQPCVARRFFDFLWLHTSGTYFKYLLPYISSYSSSYFSSYFSPSLHTSPHASPHASTCFPMLRPATPGSPHRRPKRHSSATTAWGAGPRRHPGGTQQRAVTCDMPCLRIDSDAESPPELIAQKLSLCKLWQKSQHHAMGKACHSKPQGNDNTMSMLNREWEWWTIMRNHYGSCHPIPASKFWKSWKSWAFLVILSGTNWILFL